MLASQEKKLKSLLVEKEELHEKVRLSLAELLTERDELQSKVTELEKDQAEKQTYFLELVDEFQKQNDLLKRKLAQKVEKIEHLNEENKAMRLILKEKIEY